MYDHQHRLPVTILTVIVLSYMAVGTLWLVPSLIWDRDLEVAELAARTERGIKAAQANQNAGSIVESVALLRTVIAVTPVTGVILLDTQGRGLRKIGEAFPVISSRLRRDRQNSFQAIQGCCIDLYLQKTRTGLPHDLVARIDTGGIITNLSGRRIQMVSVGFLILLLGAAVSVLVLHRIIILPLRQLRIGLAGGIARSPAQKLPRAILIRKDVIGDLGRMMDLPEHINHPAAPLKGVPRNKDIDLINEIPCEVLMFDADGNVADANGEALQLFNCRTLSELRDKDLKVFQADGEPGNGPCSLPELMQGGPKEVSVMVFGGQEPVARRIVARTGCDDQGHFECLVACLLPSSDAGPTDTVELARSNSSIAVLERRAGKLKLLLEACLTLMDSPDKTVMAAQAQPVRTDILVENWYLDASRCGLVDREMEHNVPGQIVGDIEAVTSLIRHALTYVALRSEAEIPRLAGSGEMRSADLVEFVFEEVGGQPVRDQATEGAGGHQQDGSKLPLAALTRLLASYGGKVLAVRGRDDCNLIRFVMRARPSAKQPDDADKGASNARTAA